MPQIVPSSFTSGISIILYQELPQQFQPPKLALAIAYELSLNCSQLLFEAGKVLVKCPNKGLVGPEGRLRALLGAVGGTGAWWARLRAVSRHLVYEPLQPEHRLPVYSNMFQDRAQTVLQHRKRRHGFLQQTEDTFIKI